MNYREKFKQQKEPEENKQIFDLRMEAGITCQETLLGFLAVSRTT